MDGFLSVREVARHLGRSKRHVTRLIASGRLQAKQDVVTGTRYIPADALQAFVDQQLAAEAPRAKVVVEPASAGPTPPPEPAPAPSLPSPKRGWTLLD